MEHFIDAIFARIDIADELEKPPLFKLVALIDALIQLIQYARLSSKRQLA